MLLLLVECYYSLWDVIIACGMLLLLVECCYCLWNVTIPYGMILSKFNVRDAACSLRSHCLARFARTSLLVADGWSTKIYENLRKSTKFYENLRKSTKIYENLR